jgi:hypothetical protein
MHRSLIVVTGVLLAAFCIGGTTAQAGSQVRVAGHRMPARTPNPGDQNELNAIAESGPANAWAVGDTCSPCSGVGKDLDTLILHTNGNGTWKQVPSPSPGQAILVGAAAVSATDAWAVGNHQPPGGNPLPLAEHWDGHIWKTTAMPTNVGTSGSLADVDAQQGLAWAVGSADGDSLALRRTTGGWVRFPVPSPGTGDFLESVAIVGPDDVWAVGYHDRPAKGSASFTVHWNGAHWSLAPTPNPGVADALHGVSAVSSKDVWAVGNFYTSSNQWRSLIVHWNGSSWVKVKSPNPGTIANTFMYGVDAVSSTDVWAVGEGENHLLLRWNGSKWKQTPQPQPSLGGYVVAVAALSAKDVYGAGYDPMGSTRTTIAIHWNGEGWVQQ